MLQRFIQEFLAYCRLADFSDRLHPGIDRPASGWTSIPGRNRTVSVFQNQPFYPLKEAASIMIIHEYGSPIDPSNDDMMQNAARV
jgi:hypothetical protein